MIQSQKQKERKSVVVTFTRNDKKLTIEKANRNYDMK